MSRVCYETGKPLAANAPERVNFIDSDARSAWNNRHKLRGAAIYDMFMAFRYQRGLARRLKLFSQMCRMAAEWRAEDQDKGRMSFRPLKEEGGEG